MNKLNGPNESVVSWKKSSLIFSLCAHMIRLYINRDVQKPIFVCVSQKKLKNSNPGSGWVTPFAILVAKQRFMSQSLFLIEMAKKNKKKGGVLSLMVRSAQLRWSQEEIRLFWLWMLTWETSVPYVLRPGATAHSFIFADSFIDSLKHMYWVSTLC